MDRIALLRRCVQIFSFLTIVWGGFLAGPGLETERGEIITESGYQGSYEPNKTVRWVRREKVALDAHLPATSCYYQHRGLFKGCSLLFLSESLTWLTPLVQLAPQLLLVVTLMFAFARLFCGWVCPFGFLSDLQTVLRRLAGADHAILPRRLRDGLVWTKYVLLFASLGISLLAAHPSLASAKPSLLTPFCQLCLGRYVSPFVSFATICWTNFSSPFTATMTVLGLAIFFSFFLGFKVRRFYCRICPIGGITAPFNRYGLVSLNKSPDRCTHCGACARVCPVDNLVVFEARDEGPANACECTLCLRCVAACPEKGALSFTLLGKRLASS
jgi:ferredoxin-type protein NapH